MDPVRRATAPSKVQKGRVGPAPTTVDNWLCRVSRAPPAGERVNFCSTQTAGAGQRQPGEVLNRVSWLHVAQ